MNGFATRLKRGCDFEEEVLGLLRNCTKVIAVANNGTEHTHPEFVEGLRKIITPASKFVRYAPDGVLLTSDGNVVHYDAKASTTIEKNAYETYMLHVDMGCQVLLFVCHDGEIHWASVDCIKFLDSDEVVSKFSESRRFPVVDGWISPRSKHGFRSTGAMSGTPYKEIDPGCLKRWRH